jgi:hypothetical protein
MRSPAKSIREMHGSVFLPFAGPRAKIFHKNLSNKDSSKGGCT